MFSVKSVRDACSSRTVLLRLPCYESCCASWVYKYNKYYKYNTIGFVLLTIRTAKLYFGSGEDRLLVFRVNPELRDDIQQIADEEQRTVTQVCEMLLNEGVEAYKKEGAKFMQRLVAKQKARVKDA